MRPLDALNASVATQLLQTDAASNGAVTASPDDERAEMARFMVAAVGGWRRCAADRHALGGRIVSFPGCQRNASRDGAARSGGVTKTNCGKPELSIGMG